MGMFDYLISRGNDVQVKCFYLPIYSNGKVWHSGGLLRTFHSGDEVPIKTLYYEYPKDFIVVLDREIDNYDLAYFKEGMFIDFCNIENIQDRMIINNNIYSELGRKLKIYTIEDLERYIRERKEEWEKEDRNFLKFNAKWNYDIPLKFRLGELFECYFYTVKQIEMKDSFMNWEEELDKIASDIINFYIDFPQTYNNFIAENNLKDWGDPLKMLRR